MSDNDSSIGSGVSRRKFVQAAGATGVAATLAGCGGGGDGDSNTVQVGTDPVFVENNGEAAKQALQDAGLSEDVTVEWVPGDQDTGSRRDSYQQLLSAGESSPDIMMMDNGWVNIFIQQGNLANLSEILPDDMVSTVDDEYFEGFTATARDPNSGDLFGVPTFPDFPTMLYRKDLAEQAGYDPEGENWSTEPMSWEEWSQVTADILEQSDVDHGFTTQWDIYEGTSCCTFLEVMSTWGGAYFGDPTENQFGPVGDRPITVDEQQVVDSLDMMRKFVHDEDFGGKFSNFEGGFAPSSITGWKEEDARTPFAEGNAVMHRNWPYAYALTGRDPDEVDDAPVLGTDKIGSMPIPYGVTEDESPYSGIGGTVSALGGWHWCVNPNSDKSDAIAQFFEAAMEDSFQLTLFQEQGWLPPKPELFESSEAQEVDIMGNYLDTLKVAGENTLARPVTSVWPDESSAISQQANSAVAQEKSSSQAMSDLKSRLQDIEGR